MLLILQLSQLIPLLLHSVSFLQHSKLLRLLLDVVSHSLLHVGQVLLGYLTTVEEGQAGHGASRTVHVLHFKPVFELDGLFVHLSLFGFGLH